MNGSLNDIVKYDLSSIDGVVSVRGTGEGVGMRVSLCSKLGPLSQCYDESNRLMNFTHTCTLDLQNGEGPSFAFPLSFSDFSQSLSLSLILHIQASGTIQVTS